MSALDADILKSWSLPQMPAPPLDQDPVNAGVVPLCMLHKGARGRLHAIGICPGIAPRPQHACTADDCELLRAMGLTEQCRVRVCRCGEPYIVQVNSTRLGIARAMAEQIYVEPESA
jgi:Fe2+ transport system protein FeoA